MDIIGVIRILLYIIYINAVFGVIFGVIQYFMSTFSVYLFCLPFLSTYSVYFFRFLSTNFIIMSFIFIVLGFILGFTLGFWGSYYLTITINPLNHLSPIIDKET